MLDEGEGGSSSREPGATATSYDEDGYAINNKPMPMKGSREYWQRRIWELLDDPSSSTLVRDWLLVQRELAPPRRVAAAPLACSVCSFPDLSRELLRTHRFFCRPCCPQAKAISTAMMSVILLSIGSFTIASNPDVWFTDAWINLTTGELVVGSNASVYSMPGAYRADEGTVRRASTPLVEDRSPFFEIEAVCIAIFTIEYFTRLACSPQGPGVFRYVVTPSNVIDLISILPFWIELIMKAAGVTGSNFAVLSILRLIRLTRITRIFKMSKNFEGLIMLLRSLIKSGPALLMLFAFMGISGILFATLIFTVESGVYDPHRKQYVREDGSASPFESILGSLWWTIVTMTTVGYGDQYPVSVAGKIIAVLTMFCGLVVLSLPITIIGANFDDEYRELRKRNQEEQEKKRREERRQRLRAHKEWQQQQLELAAKGTPGASGTATPQRKQNASGEGGAGALDEVTMLTPGGPLTYPPGSPLVTDGKPSEDPIKLIQTMIHESHYELSRDIEKLMIEHENKLRQRIKSVLRQHAAGVVDLRITPLDQQKPLPAPEADS